MTEHPESYLILEQLMLGYYKSQKHFSPTSFVLKDMKDIVVRMATVLINNTFCRLINKKC